MCRIEIKFEVNLYYLSLARLSGSVRTVIIAVVLPACLLLSNCLLVYLQLKKHKKG
jgi:hypothetical protein